GSSRLCYTYNRPFALARPVCELVDTKECESLPTEMRPPREAIRQAGVAQIRLMILDELRTAERDLAQRQQANPDPVRAMDLTLLHEAITALARLVATGSGSTAEMRPAPHRDDRTPSETASQAQLA